MPQAEASRRISIPLSGPQTEQLRRAIQEYAFPPDYFDFADNMPVRLADTRAVEIAIGRALKFGDPQQVKDGLSNVLY